MSVVYIAFKQSKLTSILLHKSRFRFFYAWSLRVYTITWICNYNLKIVPRQMKVNTIETMSSSNRCAGHHLVECLWAKTINWGTRSPMVKMASTMFLKKSRKFKMLLPDSPVLNKIRLVTALLWYTILV